MFFKKKKEPIEDVYEEVADREIIEPKPNPYLNAQRTWNDHVGSVVSSRQTWQVVGILSLLIALSCVGGMIHIGSQSKFIPYIIEVDKLGQATAVGPVRASSKQDPRYVASVVSNFIENARLVTLDVALQRKAVFDIYAHLSPNEPAIVKMNEWMNSDEDASPFKRAEKEMVNTQITSVLPQTPDTWQIDWLETTRDREGVVTQEPVQMRALVTVYYAELTKEITEEQLRQNPLGIFVRDFSWSLLTTYEEE